MSPLRASIRTLSPWLALSLFALGSGPAHATTYTVGTGGGCTHATLQAAVDAAAASPPEADLIRVTTAVYAQQQVAIATAQELDIAGGYSACNAATPTPNSRATLDGSGGSARPVLRIAVPTGGIVRLRNLEIRQGDQTADGEGGGIYFEGNGRLEVRDARIANNVAGYGGGLFARGTGDAATVEFGANVTVSGNTARHSGGGVYLNEVTFHMTQPGSGLFLNEALGEGGGGYGGGLMARVSNRPYNVHLGVGLGNLGVVFNNKAVYGGGVALYGESGDGNPVCSLFVYSPVVGQPAGIRDNEASLQGGGLYLRSAEGSVFSNPATWFAYLWNTLIEGNAAPTGAAYFSEHTWVNVNTDTESRAAPPGFTCAPGQFCGGIIDNVAQTPDGTATDGAIVHAINGGRLAIAEHADDRPPRGGVTIEGNRGGRLIFQGNSSYVRIENALIADNVVSLPLIHLGSNPFLVLEDVTLAGNLIGGGNPVFRVGGGSVTLRRSIVWEPDTTVLDCSGCSKTFEGVIANERTSLDGGNGTQVVVADPRFVDAVAGNYQLRAASPAVDYLGAGVANHRDVLGRARDVDLPVKAGAFGGVRDVGAFERQTLQPLVLNSDLDANTRTWTVVIPDAVFHDTLNASGPSGSGSLRVYKTGAVRGQPTIAARQCVHLPGPARYLLNGWGRSVPTGLYVAPLDSTALLWEVRHDGGEDCTGGTISARGTLNLSSDGWTRPAFPAEIDISPADWTVRTSVLVNLVVVDNSVAPNAANAEGWFDGITLEVDGVETGLFADGFE